MGGQEHLKKKKKEEVEEEEEERPKKEQLHGTHLKWTWMEGEKAQWE